MELIVFNVGLCRPALPGDIPRGYAALGHNLFNQLAFRPYLIQLIWGEIPLFHIGPTRQNTCLYEQFKVARLGRVEKMQSVIKTSDGTKIVIHFDYNKLTGLFDDFKFVS